MEIRLDQIDGGKAFDWGRTSADYARYRDVYPPAFFEKLVGTGFFGAGKRVLDLGTGTGVLPRGLYAYGAEWVGADISEDQIREARRLSEEGSMRIEYLVSAAEALSFPPSSFDAVTACQCYWYFDHARTAPLLSALLKPGGRLVLLEMEWLPFEDRVAGESEKLVLKYSPAWSGAGYSRRPLAIPPEYGEYFTVEATEEYALSVPFTRESWNGRMKACRGVGASLTAEEIADWEREHIALLERIAPPSFNVSHYAATAILRKR
ncbi:MAG: class I SAM-dependent methyltransferase [Bacteroides sp.]|nr:class I SAM-dependent methyltransferase [Roseburia sp.]MCM1462077.1 class I SAM-dependent methyltransferase [Bacteroides sp.]